MRKIIAIFIIIAAVNFSCSKNNNPTPPPPIVVTGLMPLKTGNVWDYAKRDYDSAGKLLDSSQDVLQILSDVSINDTTYYQDYLASMANIYNSFLINSDSNTLIKIDSATRYVFFKRVNSDSSLITTWADTVTTHCKGNNQLFGFTASYTIGAYTGCLRNVVSVNDCTGATFEKWVYYLKPQLGIVRIEHYVLSATDSFYLQFAEDLISYSI